MSRVAEGADEDDEDADDIECVCVRE